MPTVRKQRARKPQKGKRTKGAKSILDQATSVEFDSEEGIKINLYGLSGSGKTTLWSTFPGPILAIICSGAGVAPGGKVKPGELMSLSKEARKKVKVIYPNDTEHIRMIAAAQNEEERFATVVVDHITGLQDMCIREVGGLAEVPVQKSWGLLTQKQWGQVTLQTKEILIKFLSLQANVVLVAQERIFTDEKGIVPPFVASGVTPSTIGWLNPSVNYVCRCFLKNKTEVQEVEGVGEVEEEVEGVDYCLRVSPHDLYASKFRKPYQEGKERPEYIVNPTYEKIMKLIRG